MQYLVFPATITGCISDRDMGRRDAGLARQVPAHRPEHDGAGHHQQQQEPHQELPAETQAGYQER